MQKTEHRTVNPHSRWFEEFEIGCRYPTRSRTITLDDHLAFCRLVGYEVPLFLNAERGAHTGFGGLICPSHLIMSFSTAMTGDLFSDSVRGLLAIENARFMIPVRPGDTLSTEVEVLSKRLTSRPGVGLITFRDHVLNQLGQTVFQNDKITLIACRPVVDPQPA